MLTGLNWYLKYTAKGNITWNGGQLNLPKTLPAPETEIIKTAASDEEATRLAYDARSLLTVWGHRQPSQSGLHDYANREWGGFTITETSLEDVKALVKYYEEAGEFANNRAAHSLLTH